MGKDHLLEKLTLLRSTGLNLSIKRVSDLKIKVKATYYKVKSKNRLIDDSQSFVGGKKNLQILMITIVSEI